MSIHLYISILLLIITIILNAHSQQYVIRKDFFSGIKAPEFTVYDSTEKRIHYRIESKYAVLQNIKVIAYPSKQEVGRLQAKLNLLTFKGEFSILDRESNKWVSGSMQEVLKLFGDSYNITWGANRIIMDTEFASLTNRFLDSDGELLAESRIRLASMFWTNKYDMKIFSKKYPEQIYFLAVAVRDRLISKNKRG